MFRVVSSDYGKPRPSIGVISPHLFLVFWDPTLQIPPMGITTPGGTPRVDLVPGSGEGLLVSGRVVGLGEVF